MKHEALHIDGGLPLDGSIQIAGAKNAALPMLAAAVLADAPLEITNVPDVGDVHTLATALAQLGFSVERRPGTVRLAPVDRAPCEVGADLAGRMRASICLLGPLLARRGAAVVALPGGCELGPRPVDLHLAGLRAPGAQLRIEKHRVVATAGRLLGAKVDLSGPHGPTVTGTANVMSAAVLASGETIICNAAREPEIVDLGLCLRAMGARIGGLGTSTITVEGVARLDRPTSHQLIPDRIETATFLIAALATRGQATLRGARAEHLTAVLGLLASWGADIESRGDAISIGPGKTFESRGARGFRRSTQRPDPILKRRPTCSPSWPRWRLRCVARAAFGTLYFPTVSLTPGSWRNLAWWFALSSAA